MGCGRAISSRVLLNRIITSSIAYNNRQNHALFFSSSYSPPSSTFPEASSPHPRTDSVPVTDNRPQDHGNKIPLRNDVQQHFDIAIVGGGMVGMALACSLASNPLTKKLSVAIIDSSPALTGGIHINKDKPPEARVSTITPASISLLKDVGAWKYLEQCRHAYFNKMQVWDYTGLGYTRYNGKDVNKEFLGCVAENKVIHHSLLSCMQDIDFQKTVFPSKLVSMAICSGATSIETDPIPSEPLSHTHGQFTRLELDDGSSLFAKLVVGADGGKSRVRELAKLSTTGWKYSQNAIICTVEHREENQCAWQRFLPSGPLALLPMGDKFSNIVWSTTPEEASNLKSLNEDDFLKAVDHALDYGYGPHPQSSSGFKDMFSWNSSDSVSSNENFEVPPKVTKLASDRMVFPLSLIHTHCYVTKRVALIGDAAHTVHPLAGQGVNLGFGDAMALSKVIAEGIALGSDIGEVSLLRRYEADCKPANVAMAAILDGFQKAYSVDFGPFNILRAAAFHGAQFISPLKKSIILYASGERKLPLFS